MPNAAESINSVLEGLASGTSAWTVQHVLILTSLVAILVMVFAVWRMSRKATLREKEPVKTVNIPSDHLRSPA